MKNKEKIVIAKLVQKKGKKGVFMSGTLEGGQTPVVLFKSDFEKNESGEAIWNLYIQS